MLNMIADPSLEAESFCRIVAEVVECTNGKWKDH